MIDFSPLATVMLCLTTIVVVARTVFGEPAPREWNSGAPRRHWSDVTKAQVLGPLFWIGVGLSAWLLFPDRGSFWTCFVPGSLIVASPFGAVGCLMNHPIKGAIIGVVVGVLLWCSTLLLSPIA